MRLTPLLAIGLSLLPAPVTAEGEANATTFSALYDIARPEDKGHLRDHVEAVALGVAWANAALNFQKQKPLYCPPEKQNLTGEQALDIPRKEIEARPASGNFPWPPSSSERYNTLFRAVDRTLITIIAASACVGTARPR
jgi:hypothetical protein